MNSNLPLTQPVEIGPETFLIPNLWPGEPGTFVPVNSMLIRGREPVIVDTSSPIYRDRWLDMVFSLVDPEDVRWLFLSHDDGDHTGGLHAVLERCPKATLVTNFFSVERLSLEAPLPLDRMIWREPGDHIDAGDRRLHLVRPPIFDGPTTRGLYDETTGILWAVDSFAAMTTEAGQPVAEVPTELYDETFDLFNKLISPWHQWLDPAAYDKLVTTTESLQATTIASAHGPVLSGDAIPDAFARVRALAGAEPAVAPGEDALQEMIAATLQPAG